MPLEVLQHLVEPADKILAVSLRIAMTSFRRSSWRKLSACLSQGTTMAAASSLDDEVVISYSYSSFLFFFLFLKELPLIFKELQGASDKFRHFTTRFCRIFVSLEIFSRPVKASENLYFLR